MSVKQIDNSVLNVKVLVGAFNREKALRGFLHDCEIFVNLLFNLRFKL